MARGPCALATLLVLLSACGDDSAAGAPDAAGGAIDSGSSAPHPVGRGDAASLDAAEPEVLCTECDGKCEETIEVVTMMHVSGGVQYEDVPPVGGLHDPCWGDYGVYDAPALPPERWVHNLEHGAIVFLYRCPDGCDDDVAALTQLAEGLERTIVTPYADMQPGFAAVAWGHRLVSSCLDLDALQAFYDAHFDQAPESITTGAPDGC
jgi:hypothetical protein